MTLAHDITRHYGGDWRDSRSGLAEYLFSPLVDTHARQLMGRILDKAPDWPPEPGDELPEGWTSDRLKL